MDDRITRESLEKYGFSRADREIREYLKGSLEVVFCRDGTIIAFKDLKDIGPVSTMEQVQALDSVINPVPSDVITGDRLESSGWTPLGGGVFNHEHLQLVPRRTPPASYCVYHRSGEMLGVACKMTELSALADVTTRRA